MTPATRGAKHRTTVCRAEYHFVFESKTIDFDEFKPEIVVRNDEYYQFIISVTKYIHNRKTRSFFFIRKRVVTVQELISESMHSEKKKLARRNSMLYDSTDIGVLTPEIREDGIPVIKKIKFSELEPYMLNEE